MKQTEYPRAGKMIRTGFHAEKPMLKQPAIIPQVEVMVNGKPHYQGTEGQLYEVEAFDRMFQPMRLKIKPKGFRADIAKIRNGNTVVEKD